MGKARVATITAISVGCAVAALAPLGGRAQPTPPAPAEAKAIEPRAKPVEPQAGDQALKLYDVSDLTAGVLPFKLRSDVLPPSVLHFSKDREAWNGLFCGRKRDDADVEPIGAIDIAKIIALIESTIDDPNLAVSEFEGSLAVRADAATHAKIVATLDQIRASRPLGKSVEVVAHWVLLEPGKVAGLYKAGSREIDPQKLSDPASLYVRSVSRTITGQAVTLLSGRARSVITAQSPSVGQSAAAYDPTVSQILSGLMATVDVRVVDRFAVASVAAAAADWDEPAKGSTLRTVRGGPSGDTDKTVTIPTPSDPNNPPPTITIPAASPATPTADAMVAEIDRLNMVAMHFHTQARLPLGTPVLVGGMTLEPATGATAGKGDPRQLYLILEVNLTDVP